MITTALIVHPAAPAGPRTLTLAQPTADDARCQALFASSLQRSDAPGADAVAEAIRITVQQLGPDGCAGRMAQEFGDHPEAAAARMGWIRSLPTVKDVSAELAINPDTVVKADRQLEHEGLAAGRPGQGTFITGTLSPTDPGPYGALRRSLERWLREAHYAGLREEAVTALISVVRHDLRREGVA